MSLDGEKERTNDRDWASLLLGDRGDAAVERQKDEQGGEVPWEPQEARKGRGVRAQPCWTLWTDQRTTGNALTIPFSNVEVAGDLARGSLLGTKG